MNNSVEHVFNNNMEINAGWTATGGSATQSSGTDPVFVGTHSWKCVAGAYQGIKSNTWTSFTGIKYYGYLWVYQADVSPSSQQVSIGVRKGDNSGFNAAGNHTVIAETWTKINFEFTETAGGSGAFFQILTVPASTFYVDYVSVSSQILKKPDPYYNVTRGEKPILIRPDMRI